MTQLNSPTVRSAVRTHGDSEEDVSDPSVSHWVGHGHSRLYLNGLFAATNDVYVDLSDMTLSGVRHRSATVEWDGDELVIEIVRASWDYKIVVGDRDDAADSSMDDTEDENDGEDDGDVDLAALGIEL